MNFQCRKKFNLSTYTWVRKKILRIIFQCDSLKEPSFFYINDNYMIEKDNEITDKHTTYYLKKIDH